PEAARGRLDDPDRAQLRARARGGRPHEPPPWRRGNPGQAHVGELGRGAHRHRRQRVPHVGMTTPLADRTVWFVTGSQHLYGDEALRQVAEHAERIARTLDGADAIPVRVEARPVVTT